MGRNRAMLCVSPDTRELVKSRMGDETYDEYVRHLLDLEDRVERQG